MKLFKLLVAIMLTALTFNSCGPAAGVKEEQPLVVESPESTPVIAEENVEDNREMVDGFRVKVDSRATIDEAKDLSKEIAGKISDEQIYEELIVDQYMVYVGDCQTKEEGEELKKKLRFMGYSKSYLVPKKVFKKKDAAVSIENISPEDQSEIEQSNQALAGKEKALGYRVQVSASKVKENAEKFRRELSLFIKEKIYLVVANDMYKLQIGDFSSKPAADVFRDQLRTSTQVDLNGAFTVESVVYRSKATAGSSDSDKFFVQVGAFSSEEGANRLMESSIGLGYKAIVLKEDGMYKVIIGGYPDRSAADEAKATLINNGFDGAWVIER